MISPDEETGAARFRSTHAVDIFAFVEAKEIPVVYFETPYYLAPVPGGERVYAVLREALNRTNKVGIAYVVIRMRQHLAALVPCGPVLVLNTLRCGSDSCSCKHLNLPPEDIGVETVTEEEVEMATRLVDSMTTKWDISRYRDASGDELMASLEGRILCDVCDDIAEMTVETTADMSDEDWDQALSQQLGRRLHGSHAQPSTRPRPLPHPRAGRRPGMHARRAGRR